MFDPQYYEYGVIKIENGNVNIYCTPFAFRTITIGNAVNAIWVGSCLNVTLSDGRVRRYEDIFFYREI